MGKQQAQITCYSLLAFMTIAIVFWVMDAKYLQLERQFRKHHMAIISGSIGFLEQWNFNPQKYSKDCVLKVMFSFSLMVYPSAIIVAIVAGLFLLFPCS